MNASSPLPKQAVSADQSGHTARLVSVVLLLLALCLVVVGGQLLVAGSARYQAEAFIEDWEINGTRPSDEAWAVAKDAADRALAFYPGINGDYYDRLGQVEEWKTVGSLYGDEAMQPARESALTAYRQAVSARPDWPHSWVQIAAVKLRMLEIDDEFDRAFRAGFENGPWRIEINSRLAEIGLVAWPELNEEQREQTLESARRTAEYSDDMARQLLYLAKDIDRAEVLCDALPVELKFDRAICLTDPL